jgi:hypothetical protein
MKRSTPLKRSGFKRKSGPMKRTAMKTSRPKRSLIRDSARGEECTVNIPGVCNYDPQTVVWAHSNQSTHGKGMGLKAHDEFGCYACAACHAWLDHGWASDKNISQEYIEKIFHSAMIRSRNILIRKKLLKEEDNDTRRRLE